MELNAPVVLFDALQALSDTCKLLIEVFGIGAQSSDLTTKSNHRRKEIRELIFGDHYHCFSRILK